MIKKLLIVIILIQFAVIYSLTNKNGKLHAATESKIYYIEIPAKYHTISGYDWDGSDLILHLSKK